MSKRSKYSIGEKYQIISEVIGKIQKAIRTVSKLNSIIALVFVLFII